MSLFNQKYSRRSFVSFLEDDFLPEDFQHSEEDVSLSSSQNFVTSARRLGVCRSLELEVFEVHHSSIADARVGIAKDAFRMLLHHSYCNRALVAFVPEKGNQWRFSLLQMEAEINDRTNRIQRSYSNPRRYSFLLGIDASVKTPTQFLLERGRVRQRTEGNKQLQPIEDLQFRFSVEALTKEFYSKLYNWFLWARDPKTGVTFPNNIDTETDDRDRLEVKMIRLITRLLFVWFIKQKHLVPPTLFDEDFLRSILCDFKPESTTDGCYYNAILQNLFFATLNQEIEGRKLLTTYKGRTSYYSNKQLYRDTDRSYFTFPANERERRIKELFQDIPYLNGGLFECLDKYELDDNNKIVQVTNYDGFSHENTKSPGGNFKKKAYVPNCLFFAPEHSETVHVTDSETQDINVMGLIELFKQYNFTVEENTTSDVEVSLDPELLGRVFENLLAAYNPETQESARKSTGSFYTPREIVDYMVDESLKAYLSENITDSSSIIDSLFLDNFAYSEEEKDVYGRIEEALRNIKILDPACGSGAFPMGMLLRITDIIERLHPEGFDRYQAKLDIIKCCIYGVDIQPIAMMICKLRFFISLICDCGKDNSKPNFGIIPLPNLETKFVAANSLLQAKVKSFVGDWTRDEHLVRLQQELLDLRQGIFDLRTYKAKQNNKIKDREKCIEIKSYIRESANQPNIDRIKQLEKQIADDEAKLPLYEGEYWVDEQTMTQTSLFEEAQPTIFRHDLNREKREELQTRIARCKSEIKKEHSKVALPGFEEAVEEVTRWDPYDQNAVSPFFDAEWMFGIGIDEQPSDVNDTNGCHKKQGFDIVIGNPPYVQLQNNSGELAVLYEKCGYDTYARTGDIYCLFYERGYQLLHDNGHLCYITSNKWMRAAYGEKTRQFFATKTNPLLLVDFAGVKIFESATVDTNILLFEKCENHGNTICAVTQKKDAGSISELSDFVRQNHTKCTFLTSDSWVILSPIEQSIKRKIEAVGTPLSDWNINIYRGVLTGYNDAFIIDTAKREEILSNCKSEDEKKRTAELIRPILRGRDIKRYGYDWANLWLINTHNGIRGSIPRIDINDYPAIKQHLDKYWDRINSRADKGDTPYNLRNCAYLDDFSKPKIVWKRVGSILRFSYDEKSNLSLDSTCFAVGDHIPFLVCLLNSPMGHYLLQNAPKTGTGDLLISVQAVEPLLIPLPDNNVESRISSQLSLLINKEDKEAEKKINSLIYQLYHLAPEEIEYIERI